MIRWAIFSTLAAGLFYLGYCLLLRRDHWLRLSRAYIIGTLAFSLLYPLFRLPTTSQPVELGTIVLQPITIVSDAVATTAPTPSPLTYLPLIIYLAGLVSTLIVLIINLTRTLQRLWALPSRRLGRVRLHLTDESSEPCSFFNHIVIGVHGLSSSELHCIIAHEGAHMRMGHSLDVLLLRAMCCAAWFNPFAWLTLRELRAVHEYQADEAVLGCCSRDGYLGLLYRQATGIGYGHITNNFHSINLKKRINMMKKNQSRFGAWKMLAMLPVAALLMMVGCKPTEAQVGITTPAMGTSQVTVTVEENIDTLPVDTPTMKATVSTRAVTVTKTVSGSNQQPDTLTPDTDPEFPGGMDALFKYMSENIHYPEQAKQDSVQGRVFVRFVVETDGSVKDAEVMRGISEECDKEALRVVMAMPKWNPATVDGQPVRVNYVIPIFFKLQ